MSNRVREVVQPGECLKMIAATLNNPSIRHERIDMAKVYECTADALKNRAARNLTLTARGVVTEGLHDVLASIHAWRAVSFDILRGVHGEMAYVRSEKKKTGEYPAISDEDIEHRVSVRSVKRGTA